MPSNPLEQSVKIAAKAFNDFEKLIGAMGNSQHPNGAVLKSYRKAQRALNTAVKEQNKSKAVNESTMALKIEVTNAMRPILLRSSAYGAVNAEKQLEAYGVKTGITEQNQSVSGGLSAIAGRVQAQIDYINGLVLTDADPVLITGDKNHLGGLRPGEVLGIGAYFILSLFWAAWEDAIMSATTKPGFQKQAIAALDRRTTDCCLKVHGQVKPMNRPFHLTGTPQYAPDIDWPPFHAWCRTSVVLYLPEYDDGMTDRLQAAAARLIADRQSGNTRYKRYSDAYY